jgi:hypothetical protein
VIEPENLMALPAAIFQAQGFQTRRRLDRMILAGIILDLSIVSHRPMPGGVFLAPSNNRHGRFQLIAGIAQLKNEQGGDFAAEGLPLAHEVTGYAKSGLN